VTFEWSDGPETLRFQTMLTSYPGHVHFTLSDGRSAVMGGSLSCDEALEIAEALIGTVRAKKEIEDVSSYSAVAEAERILSMRH
jgi:hypothetical protein